MKISVIIVVNKSFFHIYLSVQQTLPEYKGSYLGQSNIFLFKHEEFSYIKVLQQVTIYSYQFEPACLDNKKLYILNK